MTISYLELLKTVFGRIRATGLAALAFAVLVPNAFGFLHITELTVEQGVWYPEDPVPMALVISDSREIPEGDRVPACYEVDIHLKPDTFPPGGDDAAFRGPYDHYIHSVSGIIFEGESVLRTWTQMIPGNLPDGIYFVQAEVTTCHGTTPSMSSPNSRIAPPLVVETAKIELRSTEYPETSIVSVSATGVQSNDMSQDASISHDGRFVAFSSAGTTLLGVLLDEDGEVVTDDDDNPVGLIGNTHTDIFVKDHWTGEIERISTPLGGSDADGPSFRPRISADSRWVVFHSHARNLVPGITNDTSQVFIRGRGPEVGQPGPLTLVSVNESGVPGNQSSQSASVSGDGRWVVFESEATNLLPGVTNNLADIYLYDREVERIVRRVNVNDDWVQAEGGHSRFPRISDDGRHVVFESRARNLTGDPVSGVWEIYVHDRNANETFDAEGNPLFDQPGGTRTRRLSVSFDESGNPITADGHSGSADLSGDGRYVVFNSSSTQFFSEPAEGTIALTGRGAEAEIRWPENEEGVATIGFATGTFAEGSIAFISNPLDAHIVAISDGGTTRSFEFDAGTGWAPNNIRVLIGANSGVTRRNLVNAINNAFLIDGEQTIRAVEDNDVDGHVGLRLTNLAYGAPEANQPIDVDLAPTLEATGFSGAGDAPDTVQAGDELEIDHGRTPPVFVRFFDSGQPDPTDHDARVLGVEIGRTAQETSRNLYSVFHELGYREFGEWDLPGLPEVLMGPYPENPEHGDTFTFSQGDLEVTFFFVDFGPIFDPGNLNHVRIGETPEETRANLLRAITAVGFEFDPLPAIIEETGDPAGFGRGEPARGAVLLRSVPEDGHRIVIHDGFIDGGTTFRFDDERDQTDFEEEEDIPVPPFEVIGPDLVRVYIPDEPTLAGMTNRLLGAIQASALRITATMGESEELGEEAILLVNSEVGAVGNIPIEIDPIDVEDDEEEEPPEPQPDMVEAGWAAAYGMTGGEDAVPSVDGGRVVFFPENLLHPRVVFEFRTDLANVGEDAHFGVQIGDTALETEGNFLAAVYHSGLPWLTSHLIEDADTARVRLVSNIASGDRTITFRFSTDNPDAFECLGDCPGDQDGAIRMPFPGGTVTLRDGINPAVTYEFTIGGSVSNGHHIPVELGATGAITRDNLVNEINRTGHLAIRAEGTSQNDELIVRLINTNPGPVPGGILTAENLGPFVTVDASAAQGGWNPRPGEAFRIGDGAGTTATFEFHAPGDTGHQQDIHARGRIPVQTELVAEDRRGIIRDRIIARIKDSGLQLAAEAGVENDNPAVFLTHLIPGPAGNVPIQILTANPSFTVRGLSGGRHLGTGQNQVYLVDRDANGNGIFDQAGHVSIELISITEEGAPGNRQSLEPVISGDGRYVAFRTQATDLQPRTVIRSDGERFPNRGGVFDFSTDEIVNFTDIDFDPWKGFSDVYVRDRETGENRRISVNRFGEAMPGRSIRVGAPRTSRGAAINYDGRFVAFETDDEAYIVGHRGGRGDSVIRGGGLAHGLNNRRTLDHNSFRDIMLHDRRFPTGRPILSGRVELSLPGIVEDDSVTVGTPIDIEAEVTDLLPGRVVASVQFFANGQAIGTATQPVLPEEDVFAIRWVPPAAGTYQIVAIATDSTGRALPMSDAQTVDVVAVTGIRPVVDVISPEIDGDRVPDNAFVLTNRSVWPFAAVVSSGHHGVDEVEFFIRNLTPFEVAENEIIPALGGVSMGLAQPEPGPDASIWRLNFDLSAFRGGAIPPGFYVVRAVARDSEGNLAASPPAPIFVAAGVFQRPSVSLSVNRREFNLHEFNRFRAQAVSQHGSISEVFLFANGGLQTFEGFDNPQEDFPYVWEGVATGTGTFNFYAVARDGAGNTSISNVVQIVIHPPGHIVRNPADLTEHRAFISQVYDDLLMREATQAELRYFIDRLENDGWTRGHVVREVMRLPEFTVVRWVLGAYWLILDQPPTYLQLIDGIAMLQDPEGELPDDPEDPFGPVLFPGVPAGLPFLIIDILTSFEFITHDRYRQHLNIGETGLTMNAHRLEEIVWERHLGRSRGTFGEREARRNAISANRVFYLSNLVASELENRLESDIVRSALYLLMLQEETPTRAEVRQLSGDPVRAGNEIAGPGGKFRDRYCELHSPDGFCPPSVLDNLPGEANVAHFDFLNDRGWIAHKEHGWLYVSPAGASGGVWVWDHIQQDWLWTRSDLYPRLYSDGDDLWLFYVMGGEPANRQVWIWNRLPEDNDKTGEWIGPVTVQPAN